MTQVLQITCDNCGTDISSTDYVPGFRLKLTAEALPHTGGSVALLHVVNPLLHPRHFCNLKCLGEWAEGKAGA